MNALSLSDQSASSLKSTTSAADPVLAPGWSVLLAASSVRPREEKMERLRTLLARSIQWRSLFEVAEHHGVLPLLYQALRGSDLIPPEEMRSLEQQYQKNLRKSLLLSRELIRIVQRLSERNIQALPYKGPALAEAVYGDLALRQPGDIDLLIHKHDLARVRDAVHELGYTPHATFSEAEERAYLRSGYEHAFDGPGGPNLLEVQWAIQPRFYSVAFDIEGFFQRAIPVPVAGQPMKSLSYEDLFLALSVHAAKHVWGRLIWICDLAQLINTDKLNWESIGQQARELGIARIVRVSMALGEQLLGSEIKCAARRAIPDDPSAIQLAREIQSHTQRGTPYNVESSEYFRLMMRLRERSSDRVRFLCRLLFTPGPGEWRAVPLPAALFPLYRIVRLSRLVKRVVIGRAAILA